MSIAIGWRQKCGLLLVGDSKTRGPKSNVVEEILCGSLIGLVPRKNQQRKRQEILKMCTVEAQKAFVSRLFFVSQLPNPLSVRFYSDVSASSRCLYSNWCMYINRIPKNN